MALYFYHKWDLKNDFAYVLQFFSLISDGLGGVISSIVVVHNALKPFYNFGNKFKGKKQQSKAKKTCNVITKDGFLFVFPTFLTTQETTTHKNE